MNLQIPPTRTVVTSQWITMDYFIYITLYKYCSSDADKCIWFLFSIPTGRDSGVHRLGRVLYLQIFSPMGGTGWGIVNGLVRCSRIWPNVQGVLYCLIVCASLSLFVILVQLSLHAAPKWIDWFMYWHFRTDPYNNTVSQETKLLLDSLVVEYSWTGYADEMSDVSLLGYLITLQLTSS